MYKRQAKKGYINSLGALTGGQALQQAKAGIEAIYLSGWQVAADANLASSMYPDQSLYPANSVPAVVDRINNTFRRADQIQWSAGIEPVSYTHLDVYKRQHPDLPTRCKLRIPKNVITGDTRRVLTSVVKRETTQTCLLYTSRCV